MKLLCLTALLCLLWLPESTMAANTDEDPKYLDAFPKAEAGMKRFVIQLPHKERGEEDDFRVEIIVGKEVETDGVNQQNLGGNIEDKPLTGWGFTYYQVSKFGPTASTLMAVPPGTKPVRKFLSFSRMIRYNSRIPVVVYVPEDGQVRYRVWAAPPEAKQATEK